jgi:hypothetical protein
VNESYTDNGPGRVAYSFRLSLDPLAIAAMCWGGVILVGSYSNYRVFCDRPTGRVFPDCFLGRSFHWSCCQRLHLCRYAEAREELVWSGSSAQMLSVLSDGKHQKNGGRATTFGNGRLVKLIYS